MQKNIKAFITKHKYTVALCLLFAFFYVLPLLLANVYYTDDMRRSITGLGWRYDGRHFASYLMSKLTGGGRISDFFPYSTIFSAMIFALTGYLVSLILGLEKNHRFKFSALVLLINPFLLENLSYRWDSLPMAVSVLAVVVPFLFLNSAFRFLLISLLGISITLFTYQASIVVYPLMVLLILLKKCFEQSLFKNMLNFIGLSSAAFVIALMIYNVMSISLPVLSEGERGKTIFFAENPLFELSINAFDAWLLIKAGFSRYFTILIIISAMMALWAYAGFLRTPKHYFNKILIPLLTALAIILIPSVLLFLKDSWATPRVLIGFSFLIYLILLFISKWDQKGVATISVLFAILALPLMASYAGALKSQHSLEVSVVQKITETVDVDNKTIAFNGQLQYSPETYVALEKYPLLLRLVPSYMKNDWMWGGMIFNQASNYMYAPNFAQGEERSELIKNKTSLPKVAETYYYTLRADSTRIVVDFEDSRINRK